MPAELAVQLDWLAQGPNLEDWGDVLVIAIMALLWLAGALAKVLTSRKGSQQEGQAHPQARKRETWQERLARKAQEMQRAAEAKGRQLEQEARARTQTARPSPPAGKITVRTDQKGDSVMVYERPAGEPQTQRQQQAARQRSARQAIQAAGKRAATVPAVEPQIEIGGPGYEPALEGMTGVLGEPPESLVPAAVRSEASREPAGGFHLGAIIDYSDPDALRKAILHYEILGKPIALREPQDDASF